jgi:hypothetical protein
MIQSFNEAEVHKKKRLLETVYASFDNEEKEVLLKKSTKFILTRHLGHRLEMPLSAKWRLLTEPYEKCWHCDRHHYSIVMWSPEIVAETQELSLDDEDRERLIEDLNRLNPNLPPDFDEPVLAGSFTNWIYIPMT